MLLARVVETSEQIGATTKRTQKTELLAGLLRQLSPAEVPVVVHYLSGTTRQGRIGIGYATLREASGTPAAEPSLEIASVDRALDEYASVSGKGSQSRRFELLRTLFAAATEPEQRFLFGLLTGELRQGALEGIMLDAVAKATGLSLDRVRRAAMLAGNVAAVASDTLAHGEAGLAAYDIQLFRPLQPMLAQTAEDIDDAIAELGDAALEYKMDGARVQVHRSGDQVVVFSRGMNDVTGAVPEIVEAVRAMPGRDLILDGEVISLRPDGRPHPFQITMRRFGRKLDVEKLRSELPLQPFWFDLMYLDGGSLLDEPQAVRFEQLRRITPVESVMPGRRASTAEAAAAFLDEALARGHEGIMAKAVAAPYAAGARGQSWLKVKKANTLDLVILAAEWGNGRRQGWLSNLHLGARDTEKGGYAMLGKTFKGLTDEMLAWQTEEFQKIELARDNYTVYLQPKIVAEIAFNEIQVSSRYPSGLALRFARVKRYRPDKQADQADTFATVKALAESMYPAKTSNTSDA